MTTTHLTVAVVLALALPANHGESAEPKQQVTALAPKDIRWSTPAYYTDGIVQVSGHGVCLTN